MPSTKNPTDGRGGKKGSFASSRTGLLSLFSDPDGCGTRSWRETFGYERRAVKLEGGQPFIARAARKSSSDSK